TASAAARADKPSASNSNVRIRRHRREVICAPPAIIAFNCRRSLAANSRGTGRISCCRSETDLHCKRGCDQLTPVAALVPLVCLVFGSFVLGGHNFAISRVNLNLLNARVTAPRDVERVNQSAALLLQLSGHHTQALSADARQRLL